MLYFEEVTYDLGNGGIYLLMAFVRNNYFKLVAL
jgi:hypothetical protein